MEAASKLYVYELHTLRAVLVSKNGLHNLQTILTYSAYICEPQSVETNEENKNKELELLQNMDVVDSSYVGRCITWQ